MTSSGYMINNLILYYADSVLHESIWHCNTFRGTHTTVIQIKQSIEKTDRLWHPTKFFHSEMRDQENVTDESKLHRTRLSYSRLKLHHDCKLTEGLPRSLKIFFRANVKRSRSEDWRAKIFWKKIFTDSSSMKLNQLGPELF